MKKLSIQTISLSVVFVIILSTFSPIALAVTTTTHSLINMQFIEDWLSLSREEKYGEFGSSGRVGSFGGGRGGGFTSNQPQKYYTTPTESVEDKYGNVVNYYRGGDTTTTKIIDSYNHTFNNIWSTSNTTNNYSANVKLSDFLNTYATYNNNYTYNTRYQSWYYDNTQNTLNYSDDDTYYAYDNRQYFVSIDNSTDEYYLIDVQYSPTFVTVNYNYYNTTNNYGDVGDVTNIYYFELTDGRNSSTLSASEVAGLDLGYDVANYVLVPDDPNTLSLQHFDGDYSDSSSYGRDFYSENRSTNYVDSGAFGQAVKLSSGSAAGVTIPGLFSNSSLSFDFRIYYANPSDLGIYIGDTNIFQEVPTLRKWVGKDVYDDDGEYVTQNIRYNSDGRVQTSNYIWLTEKLTVGEFYTFSDIKSSHLTVTGVSTVTLNPLSTAMSSYMTVPTSFSSPDYIEDSEGSQKYGWLLFSGKPVLHSSVSHEDLECTYVQKQMGSDAYNHNFLIHHYIEKEYHWSPSQYVLADFNYDTYKNQWISMRIVVSGGKLYYFVNGDLVGSGAFTMPSADKFYIKSSGTLYLDELRVSTGDMVSTGTYTPSNAPFDTNKVLALPDELTANTIYVKHSTPVSSYRIGGVRPSNPTTGFFYIPLHEDYTGGQPQLYDGSNWVDVEAMVYDGKKVSSALGYVFSPVGASPDVDEDLEPGRPPEPGEDVDQSTCTHSWEETSRTEATCILAGSVTYTCSKCGANKTESIAKLGHTWEVKTTVQTSYDEEGNIVTQGYTIYKCSVCGEEYKDTDGTGPPVVESPDDSDGGGWFSELLKKIGEFFGTTIGGLLELVGTIISKVLDSLITLVTNTIARLKELVNLFGSFSESMGTLWSWLPPEIVSVLVAGVTIIVFAAIIRLFLK